MILFALLGCAPPCEVPEDLGVAPLEVHDTLDLSRPRALGGAGWLVHLVDLAFVDELLVGGGSGGVWTLGEGEDGLHMLGRFEPHEGALITHLAPLPGARVAALERSTNPPAGTGGSGFGWQGVRVLDVSDPTAPHVIAEHNAEDIVAIAAWGGDVVVLRSFGALEVLRVEGEALTHVKGWESGLETPKGLAVAGDLAYVADADAGLLVYDLGGAGLVGLSPAGGAPAQVALGDGELMLASGAAGVEVFSLSDPEHPVSLGLTEVGGSATQVALADDLVWVSTLDGVAVLERERPGALRPVGFVDTERFSLCVEPDPQRPGGAYGCSWSELHRLEADAGVLAPQLSLGANELVLAEGEEALWLPVANRGGSALSILDVAARAEGFSAAWPSQIAPGESGSVLLELLAGYSGRGVEVCLTTDDPRQPLTTLPLHTGAATSELSLGVAAPDFALRDLEGRTHHLSDYRGKPVLLTWFATWCPICRPELGDLEQSVWQRYGGEVQVLAAAAEDGEGPLRAYRDELGLSYPVLLDLEQEAVRDWAMDPDFSDGLYPREFLISPEGEIAYISNSYDPEALIERIDAMLDPRR